MWRRELHEEGSFLAACWCLRNLRKIRTPFGVGVRVGRSAYVFFIADNCSKVVRRIAQNLSNTLYRM